MKNVKCYALLRLFLLVMFFSGIAGTAFAFDRVKLNIDPGWKFYLGTPVGSPQGTGYDDTSWKYVSLPHSLDVYKTDLSNYTRTLGWYRKTITIPQDYLTKKIFLEFQGAMEVTSLYVNGSLVGQYKGSGYDSFHFDITGYVAAGSNTIVVLVDNNYNFDIPPEGNLDYVLFGGLYRDVFLVVTESMYINFPWEARDAGIRVTTPTVSQTSAIVNIDGVVKNDSAASRTCTFVTEIKDKTGTTIQTVQSQAAIAAGATYKFSQAAPAILNPNLWSPSSPYLYSALTTVKEGATVLDQLTTRFGIRWFSFSTTTGFSLNGQPFKLVGANRHQTWPYVGNAVPNAIHRRDAEQLKEIGLNWVRCSHYPHDPDFLDALDELGLFALEEGPTWMGQGNAAWLANLEKSFRSMLRRDRNHPSIIIWNSCVNHEGCNATLSAAATNEDPTRPRGACDVPTPMDFSAGYVSGNGALTIEHTGHTYPSARGDAATQLEHAKRHWEMTNAAYNTPSNSGLAVWCGFDYNTTRNTDEIGIAHHGVFDIYRLPKLSYYWHTSELTTSPMVYVYKTAASAAATVFSNCSQVRLYQNTGGGDVLVATQSPDTGAGKDKLKHPPFTFTVNASANSLRAEGLMNGTVSATYTWRKQGTPAAIKLVADRASIVADGSDFTRIIASVVDSNGTCVETASNSISFAISGAGELVGDNPIAARAGMIIILAKSTLTPGTMQITATATGLTQSLASVTTTSLPANYYVPDPVTTAGPTPEPTPVQTIGPTPAPGSSLALNKTVSASGSEAINPAANGNDGNTATRWCASDGTFPQWWMVDLGGLYDLSESAITWEMAGRIYGYTIEGSADNSKWVMIVDNMANTGTDQVQRDYFSAIGIRYVRVSVTSATSYGWASFYEFEIFGTPSTGITIGPTPGPTMAPNDSIPDQFAFSDITGAELASQIVSQPIAISGINVASPISITGGEYKINGGVWTIQAGTVISGDAVSVRITSSSSYSTMVSARVTIGGVSDSFDVTTKGNSQPNLGDVNNDGSVDIVDALLIAQYYVGLNPPGFISANADVNCNGAVDIVDALVVAQYYVGLLAKFC